MWAATAPGDSLPRFMSWSLWGDTAHRQCTRVDAVAKSVANGP